MGLLYGIGSRLKCLTESQSYTELHGLTVSHIRTHFQGVTVSTTDLMFPVTYRLCTNQTLPLRNDTALTRQESRCEDVGGTESCESRAVSLRAAKQGQLALCIRCTDIPDKQDADLVGVGGPPPALVGLWHSCSLATHLRLHCSCPVTHTASYIHLTQACVAQAVSLIHCLFCTQHELVSL